MVLVVCTSSDDALYFMLFHENILNGFQVIEQTRFCDRQTGTDGRTDNQGKNNMFLSFQVNIYLFTIHSQLLSKNKKQHHAKCMHFAKMLSVSDCCTMLL